LFETNDKVTFALSTVLSLQRANSGYYCGLTLCCRRTSDSPNCYTTVWDSRRRRFYFSSGQKRSV